VRWKVGRFLHVDSEVAGEEGGQSPKFYAASGIVMFFPCLMQGESVYTTRNEPLKQRLLVLNGYRLLQCENAGQWEVSKVEKAGALKPGIYNIYLATPADKAKTHAGIVLYADNDFVYQQIGKTFVRHDRTGFQKLPSSGTGAKIRYENEQTIVSTRSTRSTHRLSS
jgi:hypothetical protein